MRATRATVSIAGLALAGVTSSPRLPGGRQPGARLCAYIP